MQAAPWRQRLYSRIARTLLLIPAFGALLLAALWLALASRLHTERAAEMAGAMRATESVAAALSEYSLRGLRDIDRTAWLVKAQFEHDGIVNLPYLIKNRLVPVDGPVRVSVTDSTGNVVATTGDFGTTINVADRSYFRKHAEADTGLLDISPPLASAHAGQVAIEMSRRLNLGDGAFGGIVVLSVDPGYFTDFYRESQLGKNGMLAVFGTDGIPRALYAPDRANPGSDERAAPMFSADVTAGGRSVILERASDHRRWLVVNRGVEDYPLVVAVAQAEDEVLADFVAHRRIYLVAASIGSAVIVIFFTSCTLLAYRARRSAREIRRQRSFLQALVDNIPLGVVVRSMKEGDLGRIIVWNPAAEFMFAVPAATAVGKTMNEVMPRDFAADVAQRDRALLASPMAQHIPQVVANVPHRGRRVFGIIRAPIYDRADEVEYIVSIINDATDEQARIDELRLNAKVFETTADAIVLCDAHDRVISVNAAFSKLTGFAPGDMLGKLLLESPFGPSDRAEYAAQQEQLAKDGCVMGEVPRYRKDGSELPCWLTKTCVRDEGGSVVNYVRVFTDISRLKAAQQELERLASVDTLTGLLNRRMFRDRIERALKRAQRAGNGVGLLFIDLDDFKRVNDIHGHAAGDAVLKEVGRRFSHCVRAGDSLCRLDGDEFTIVMEDAKLPGDSLALAQRIALELETPFAIAGRSVFCHASIGIALYPDHGGDADTLQQRADMAMYQAKHGGRRRYAMAAASSGEQAIAVASTAQ